ncbi:hypothetical protein BX600DRAFT_509717 [Xylariales sp. PMI_506]|nr:hypothetical protein BX600DRAFT_509717 [Xylariales sp. PMI_506]
MPLPPRQQPPLPKAAEPKYGPAFDAWNSSSTGHQRAENRLSGSTGWRESRSAKLQSQFRGGAAGGQRLSDSVGAGSKDWDVKAKALIPPAVRARARNSVMDMLARPGVMKQCMTTATASTAPAAGAPSENPACGASGRDLSSGDLVEEESQMAVRRVDGEIRGAEGRRAPRKLFEGVVVYVNGSTHPLISDHKLKHVLAEHGASMSIHLARRQVTHVILGRPASGAGSGAGGGLAGGKLQKEISKVRGHGVKFVSVEWVLESIKAGKRLPEGRFSNLKIAAKAQPSVFDLASVALAKNPEAPAYDNEPPPSGQIS